MKSPDSKSLDELRMLFQTADLVKFAKYSTLINENDANLMSAIEFINDTKQENMPTEETVKPELTQEEIRSNKERKALKWTIVGISAVCVGLLGYIIYNLYQLLF
jgi:preprotein translocase subunit Sss1